MKHTPGPWACHLDGSGFNIYQDDGVGNGDAIVTIPGNAEAEANARLIAAAPDLLEALRGLLERIDSPYIIGRDSAEVFVGRDALLKATGHAMERR